MLTYPIVEIDHFLLAATFRKVASMNENVAVRNVEFYVRRQRVGVAHADNANFVVGHQWLWRFHCHFNDPLRLRYFLPCSRWIGAQRMHVHFHCLFYVRIRLKREKAHSQQNATTCLVVCLIGLCYFCCADAAAEENETTTTTTTTTPSHQNVNSCSKFRKGQLSTWAGAVSVMQFADLLKTVFYLVAFVYWKISWLQKYVQFSSSVFKCLELN